MEDLPLGRIAALVPEFAVKYLPLGRTPMMILIYNLARSVIRVRRKNLTISMCRFDVGKTIKVRYFGPLLCIRVVPGWVKRAAPDMQGKGGEKRHVHSTLNSSFVAESRVGSR